MKGRDLGVNGGPFNQARIQAFRHAELDSASILDAAGRVDRWTLNKFRVTTERGASYYAASSCSAPPKSTLTRRLTPRSTIVTPNRRCMRLIVTALCVTIR